MRLEALWCAYDPTELSANLPGKTPYDASGFGARIGASGASGGGSSAHGGREKRKNGKKAGEDLQTAQLDHKRTTELLAASCWTPKVL